MSSALALPVANNDHYMLSHRPATRRRPTHPDRRRDTFQLLQVMIEENNKRIQREREVVDPPEHRRRSSPKLPALLTNKDAASASEANTPEHTLNKPLVRFATPPSPTRAVARRTSTTMEKLRNFLHLSPSSSSRIKASLPV
ncbi:hypothetical protein BX666DRAFT_2030103 [Dichotomocladium elegans]|nr:hypothetical protein BX666DRAFT_2030103 [Dichotomocladium elegans]